MKRFILPSILAVAGGMFGSFMAAQHWTGLASDVVATSTYQLVSERDGDAYIIDHDMTAQDCASALFNERAHTVLRDAVLYCEVER